MRWFGFLVMLPAVLPAQTVGGRVHTVAAVCARPDTLVSGTGCGTGGVLRAVGDKGTVLRGPAGSTTPFGLSWYIHYDVAPDGWSTAKYLAVDSVPLAAVVSLTVTPAIDTLALGASVQLVATTFDSAGRVLTGRPVSWTVSTPVAAVVTPLGLVTGTVAGMSVVQATSGLARGVATIVVTAPVVPPPVPVAVLPRVTALKNLATGVGFTVGNSVGVTAIPVDSAGDLLGNVVTWTSLDTTVVRVSSHFAGLSQGVDLTGLAPGTATVTASVGTVRAATTVNVTAPDTTVVVWRVGGVQVPSLPSLRHFTFPILLTLFSRPCYVVNATAPGVDSVVATATACFHGP